MIKKVASALAIVSLISTSVFGFIQTANAASVTSFSDTLSTLTASTAANHEIKFVTPGGLTDGQTITLTFDADFTGLGSITEDDVDFATGSSNNCVSATFTEQATATSPSGATYGVGIAGQVITLTSGTGDVTADRCVRFRIGTNATNSGTGANRISNGVAANAHSVAVNVNSGTDTGTAAIDIIADDSVNITATVDPTITFTISDVAVGFGTLSSSQATWANSGATGTTSQPAASAGAHEMTVATNAASGYTVTYNGATLTNGLNTISVATITGDADGTPASEQFAIAIDDNGGNVTIPSAYDYASNNYSFVAGTTTTLASETVATTTETIDVQYIANIATTTEAGAYSTDITYIATGNF